MMRRKSLVLAAFTATIASALVSSTSFAAIVTYNDKAAFLAAIAASPALVTFEGTDTSGDGYTSYSPGANFGPGNVTTIAAGTLYSVTTGFGAANSDGDTNVIFNGNSGGTLTLNGTFSAFGMDVMNLNTNTTPNVVFNVTYTGGAGSPVVANLPAPAPNAPPPLFFGVVGTAGELFTSLVAPPGNTPYFDNVTLGTAVPEPASLGLLAVGGIGLLARVRRRRN